MTIPEAARACSELIQRGCSLNLGCTICKCIKTGLCTELCTWSGEI